MERLQTILERYGNKDSSKAGSLVHQTFDKWVKSLSINNGAKALSVSVGNGVWDYSLFKEQPKIQKIIATDIVDNPVVPEDAAMLKKMGQWQFVKVKAEKPLPFSDNEFDLIFHLDVVEHVDKPYSFLSDQYRLLKKGGYLLVGTPNLFRPANIIKLLLGKLNFPSVLGEEGQLGKCVHVQEFNHNQMIKMLEEIGFEIKKTKHCFFGWVPLNLKFADYPKSKQGKLMCHYLMFLCKK